MKLYTVLDMTGNQIHDFLVENGSVSGLNPLTAQTGRLAYNIGDRSLYYGYDNSTDGNSGDIRWSRLVDAAHIGDYISQYAVSKTEEVVETQTYYKGGFPEIGFLRSNGSVKYRARIEEASNEKWGLMSPKMVGKLLLIDSLESNINDVERELANRPNWDSAYSWGNHADAGYAKAFKVDAIYDPSLAPTFADRASLVSASGKSDWVQSELAFDVAHNMLLCKCTRTESGKTYDGYIRSWSAANNIEVPSYYTKQGTLLFVNGNSSVYKYDNGAWSLYFSATSGDVADRVKTLEDLLNVGDNLATTIDTWNDLTKFLGGIEPSDNGLYTWMTNTESSINDINQALDDKADKSEVIMKPTEVGNDDDVLTLQSNGSAKWSTRKIVRHLGNIIEEREDLHSNDWYIDITSLGTTDVSVSLYLDSNVRGTWEQFIADVSVYEYQEGDPVVSGIRAKVSFGTIPAQDVKAVIIA